MGAWVGLLKKEWRLGLPAFLIPLFLTILCLGLGAYGFYRSGEPLVLMAVALSAIGGHLLYLPWYMAYSINGEQGKLHLWLHNPQSGYQLLLAKYVCGLITMVLSMTLPYLVLFTLKHHITFLKGDYLLLFGWLTLCFIVFFSLYLTVWGVFLWTLSRTLVPYFGRLRWLVMFGLIIVGTWLFSLWESTPLFDVLTHWGALEVDFTKVELKVGGDGFEVGLEEGELIYLGSFLYYSVVIFFVFLLSGWLLDRKVEV